MNLLYKSDHHLYLQPILKYNPIKIEIIFQIFMQKFSSFLLILSFVSFSLCAYNEELGHKLCRLLVSTYCRAQHVKQWTCKPCRESPIQLKNVQSLYNSTGHVLGILGISDNPKSIGNQDIMKVLAFRGTIPWIIQNDYEDNDFVKVQFPQCNYDCKVHRGFYHSYLDLAGQVYRGVRDYMERFQIKQVIVTGHSFGGPLATHAAIDLVYRGIKVKQFYSFGSYRIGDLKFSQWFQKLMNTTDAYRITHARDPVIHIPSQKHGFNHVTHEIFYPGSLKEGYIDCQDSQAREDPQCADRHKFNPMVSDHVNYYGIDFMGIIIQCL